MLHKILKLIKLEKTGLNGYVMIFCWLWYIDVSDEVDIQKYLMKNHNIKKCSD